MSDKEIPLSVSSRHRVLFLENSPKEVLIEIGKKYFSKGMLYDALEYFEKAQDENLMLEIKEKSIELADLVLYQNVCRAMKIEINKDELVRLKEYAEKMGKESVAQNTSLYLISRGKKQNA